MERAGRREVVDSLSRECGKALVEVHARPFFSSAVKEAPRPSTGPRAPRKAQVEAA